MKPNTADQRYLATLLGQLGIDPDEISRRALPLYRQARRLAPVGLGTDHRDKVLTPRAAQAWLKMREAAAADGVVLSVVSAFRSYDYQALLIRQKLGRGRTLAEILAVNAPPGCSEHHTGRALDIGTPGCPPVDEVFEQTEAYAWLRKHAGDCGFSLSYPRGNPHGYVYEPWHWRFGHEA